MAEVKSITCPVCKMTSFNPNDIESGYCGNCHRWTHGTVRVSVTSDTGQIKHRGDGKQFVDTLVASIRRFKAQYRRCRTRELSRPLGVWHAIKHSFHLAFGRGSA